MNNNNGDVGGYFHVQDRLFDWYGQLLGPIAIAVYNYLARCADQNGCCFPSYEDIARKVGISRSSALRAIAKLVKYNLITVKGRRHRQEHRGDHTSNCYKIRLEAFTDKGAHREVVSQGHQVVSIRHQLVSQGHSKDYPLKDNPNKEKEREGEIPPSTPPDSLSVFSNSPQEGETSKVGGDVKAVTARSAGGDNGLGCQNQAVGIATKVNGKPTTEGVSPSKTPGENPDLSDPIPGVRIATRAKEEPTRARRSQSRGNGAGQPLPVSSLSDDAIEAAMREIGWTEARAKTEAPKFRDRHLSKGTLSHDWQAEVRLWKQRGDEWESREREHVRANGKVEKTAPRPPLFVAEPKAPIDPSKPRPSHMPEILAEMARVAAQR